MKFRFWIVCALTLMLLTSCDLVSPQSQPLAETAAPATPQTTLRDAIAASPMATALPIKTVTSQPLMFTKAPAVPTLTWTPAATNTPDTPSKTPSITPTQRLLRKPSATQALLGAQIGSPVGVPNFAHPDLGCQWMGLAGQIFDIDDKPLKDRVVEVGGTLAGKQVFGLAISGQAEFYGPGGYEITLGDEPIASDGTLWAQIFDLDGQPISSLTYFQTYANCGQNLIILNFTQLYEPSSSWAFLPLIYKNSLHP